MIRRLKIKFVCINMAMVCVMLAMIFGLVLQITGRNMEEQGKRILQNVHEVRFPPGHIFEQRRVPYFMVTISKQGSFELVSDQFFQQDDDIQLLRIAAEVYEGGEKEGFLKEHNLRFSRRNSPAGEQIVFMDVSVERAMMQDLIKTCTKICLLSFLLFLGLSILLANWAVRPVETAWKNQQQFVADASHELKTPLTVITTNAELMQEEAWETGMQKQFVMNILSMSRQMRGLVEGLLELSRVDNGLVKTFFSDVNISCLVSDCLLPFEPLFFEKGMALSSGIELDILIRGSEAHLRQMVDILLDNAAKYGAVKKPVEVRLNRQGRNVLLCVATAGEPISKEDLKNIFKRFYRIDKARTMNHSYGLGLSIAEGIVKDHRGRVWAESGNGNNSFFVLLPACTGRTDG